MRNYLYVVFLTLLWSAAVSAAGLEYRMRVDGLACPYCAYGIEKKFKQIQGVEFFDIDLDRGVVTVKVADGVELTEPRMKQLFQDAGFTYRGMTKTPL